MATVRRSLSNAWGVLRDAFEDLFYHQYPWQMAAALSYYTLLSLAPLLLVVIASAGLIWGEEAVREQLVHEIQWLTGEEGAKVIRTVIANAAHPGRGVVSMVIGVVTLLVGATTVFAQLQTALNQIWEVQPATTTSAVRSLIRSRLVSLAMVLAIGFLLLISLVISAVLAALRKYLADVVPANLEAWSLLNQGASLVVVALLIAMIFKVLPDARVLWRDVWIGAATTSVLFTLGKYVIGLYLGQASIGSTFGAAGSVVVLMVWTYYAALIFFYGAEITKVSAKRRRGAVVPAGYAVRQHTIRVQERPRESEVEGAEGEREAGKRARLEKKGPRPKREKVRS